MKRSYLFVAVLLCGVIGTGSVASAALTPGQVKEAQGLIAQFSAKEFAARQAAVEKLIALGPDVVPLIRKTLAAAKDPEVKLRSEMVLKGIADKFGPAAETPADRGTYDASKITLDVKDLPLDEALAKLAEESGNKRVDLPQELRGKTASLSVKEMRYWEALDKLCESAGLRHSGIGGLVARPPDAQAVQAAYAGPVVVRISQTHVQRNFRDPASPRTAMVMMEYGWEDRLPVTGASACVAKATAEDGSALNLPGGGQFMDAGPVTGNFPRSGSSFLAPMMPLADKVTAIGSIEGTVKLQFRDGTTKDYPFKLVNVPLW